MSKGSRLESPLVQLMLYLSIVSLFPFMPQVSNPHVFIAFQLLVLAWQLFVAILIEFPVFPIVYIDYTVHLS